MSESLATIAENIAETITETVAEGVEKARNPRGVARRAGVLVAISGPYHVQLRRQLARVPLANVALTSAFSSFYAVMTAGPYLAVQRVVDSSMGGPAVSRERMAARRRAILLGNAATIAVGVLAQRAVNHSEWGGPVGEAGRVVGSQLAIGGVASALVLGTDMALGDDVLVLRGRRSAAVASAGFVAVAQRRLLRRMAPLVTLPTVPRTVTIPVRNGWRIRDVELSLAP